MIREDIRNELSTRYELGDESKPVIFENPSFDNSIVGITVTGDCDRLVYDYDLMIDEYQHDNNCELQDAIDFVEYNTMRAYSKLENSPIIITRL